MVIALALLAQITAAPTPASTPTPTLTAAVGTASSSVPAGPRTLADVARERKLGKKGVVGGTLSVAGTSVSPVGVAPGEPRSPGASATSVSSTTAGVRAAEAEVRAARQALDDTAARKGMTSEDTAAQRARLARAQKDLTDAYDAAAHSAR